jgi:hypothetical protein
MFSYASLEFGQTQHLGPFHRVFPALLNVQFLLQLHLGLHLLDVDLTALQSCGKDCGISGGYAQ